MKEQKNTLITSEMLTQYYELYRKKKEIEVEMNQLKATFHDYFDEQTGKLTKGEIILNGFKLQRQIRKTDKFNDEKTVKRLEELKMKDLIVTIKKPDTEKIKSALHLGFLQVEDLKDCIVTTSSTAITIKPLTPR